MTLEMAPLRWRRCGTGAMARSFRIGIWSRCPATTCFARYDAMKFSSERRLSWRRARQRLAEKENTIFGVILCASAAYDWWILYKDLFRVGSYYADGVYVLPSLSFLTICLFALYSTCGGLILLTAKRSSSRYTSAAPNLVAISAVFAPYLFAALSKGALLGVNVYAAYFCVISGALITLVS